MRITWHRHENALHFLFMDEPVLSRREVSPGVVELLDTNGRLVRVDVRDIPAALGATYHAGEDWLDVSLRDGEFQRHLQVVPKMAFSLGPNDEVLRIQLRDAWRGWHIPLEDIALLVLEAAVAGGGNRAEVDLPEGLEAAEYERSLSLMAARGWQVSAATGPDREQTAQVRLPRSVTFVRQG